MTFGKLKDADWLKYDRNGIEVFVRFTKKHYLDLLRSSRIEVDDNADMEEIIEKVKEMCKNEKLFWEFEKFAGVYYLDIFASDQSQYLWNGDYDDFRVETIDLKNFKLPAFFLSQVD